MDDEFIKVMRRYSVGEISIEEVYRWRLRTGAPLHVGDIVKPVGASSACMPEGLSEDRHLCFCSHVYDDDDPVNAGKCDVEVLTFDDAQQQGMEKLSWATAMTIGIDDVQLRIDNLEQNIARRQEYQHFEKKCLEDALMARNDQFGDEKPPLTISDFQDAADKLYDDSCSVVKGGLDPWAYKEAGERMELIGLTVNILGNNDVLVARGQITFANQVILRVVPVYRHDFKGSVEISYKLAQPHAARWLARSCGLAWYGAFVDSTQEMIWNGQPLFGGPEFLRKLS